MDAPRHSEYAGRPQPDGVPGFFVPYFQREPLLLDDHRDYADETARLQNSRTSQWVHPLGETVTALIDAGLRIDKLIEHPFLDWKVDFLVEDEAGKWRLPTGTAGELPLMFSLLATKPA